MFCFLSLKLSAQQNFIVAADTVGVVYSDIVPDTTFTFYDLNPDYYNLDLNNDGSPDFIIYLLATGDSIYNYRRVIISALNNNGKVASDSSGYFLSMSFFSGDTIKSKQQLWDSSSLIWSYYEDGLGQIHSGDWVDGESHFAGVMMAADNDTTLGWVRIKIGASSFPENASIFDYASTKGFGIGVEPVISTTQEKIFPNPTEDILHVSIGKKCDFELLSVLNKRIKSGILKAGINDIDIRTIQSGIYFLLIDEDGKMSITKFMKAN